MINLSELIRIYGAVRVRPYLSTEGISWAAEKKCLDCYSNQGEVEYYRSVASFYVT